MRSLHQHVAMITGASKGIGRGTAIHLASLGCNLVLTARNAEALAETAKACEKHSVQVKTFVADIRSKETVRQLVDFCIQTFGEIDIVILNQGVAKGGLFAEDAQDEWEEVIDVNLKASMTLTRFLLPHLQHESKKHRALIYISSMAAKFTSAKLAAYHTSKAGLLAFGHCIFEEVREYDIKVSVLCPGMVNTDMIRSYNIDLEKVMQVSDIAETISYVIHSSPTVCPVEILLRPQKNPYL